jgi:hypothetical protein
MQKSKRPPGTRISGIVVLDSAEQFVEHIRAKRSKKRPVVFVTATVHPQVKPALGNLGDGVFAQMGANLGTQECPELVYFVEQVQGITELDIAVAGHTKPVTKLLEESLAPLITLVEEAGLIARRGRVELAEVQP